MSADEIVPLVKKTIPTIVGFDPASQAHTIGDEARRIGLNGKTTVFNFKPAFGLGDKEFSTNKKYWYWLPATPEHPEHVENVHRQRSWATILAEFVCGGRDTSKTDHW